MLADIQEFHRRAAEAASVYPEALPIFERMEIELAEAEAEAVNDPVSRARRRLEAKRMTS